MITYINKDNAAAYHQLFIKAEDALKEHANPSDFNLASWDDFAIGSLNEYFAYLEPLMNLSALSLDQKRMFVRLPLDEDIFEINADARTITVPSTFARYGIGVQGDEMAEVVYFTVDRFFDSMDLAGHDMQIAIQWEAKDANKQKIVGFSRNFGKEIVNVKDKNGNTKNKIVFGWPISSELTQTSGTIKFAVRFYSVETIDGNNQFTYSFTTLPAEVAVNATLDYNLLNNSIPEIDHGQTITGRIRSSGIYDPDAAEMPEDPVITTQLHAIGAEGQIIDLPKDNSGVELAISAQPTTVGTINYRWNKYDYIDGDYTSNTSALPSEDSVEKHYLEITTNIPVDDQAFFYNESQELVTLADTLEETNGYYVYNEGEGFQKINNTGAYMKIYKEFSVATVHSVGKYIVTAVARAGANTAEKTSDTITIPGPLKPTVKYAQNANISDNTVHIIADNEEGRAALFVTATPGEDEKSEDEVGLKPDVDLAYNWVKKENGEDIALHNGEGIVYSVDNDDDENYSILTITGLTSDALDVVYCAKVTASRNNVETTQESFNYRITHAPEKPVLKYRQYDGNNFVYVKKDYTTEVDGNNRPHALPINLHKRDGSYNSIAFAVEPPTQSDKLSYIWMRANIQAEVESDWEEPELAKLQIDVDDALPDLFPDPDDNADADFAVNGGFDLTVLQNLGQIVDNEEENGPALTLSENTPAGYYYCIVVNELNNNKAANVTPFFHVS